MGVVNDRNLIDWIWSDTEDVLSPMETLIVRRQLTMHSAAGPTDSRILGPALPPPPGWRPHLARVAGTACAVGIRAPARHPAALGARSFRSAMPVEELVEGQGQVPPSAPAAGPCVCVCASRRELANASKFWSWWVVVTTDGGGCNGQTESPDPGSCRADHLLLRLLIAGYCSIALLLPLMSDWQYDTENRYCSLYPNTSVPTARFSSLDRARLTPTERHGHTGSNNKWMNYRRAHKTITRRKQCNHMANSRFWKKELPQSFKSLSWFYWKSGFLRISSLLLLPIWICILIIFMIYIFHSISI